MCAAEQTRLGIAQIRPNKPVRPDGLYFIPRLIVILVEM